MTLDDDVKSAQADTTIDKANADPDSLDAAVITHYMNIPETEAEFHVPETEGVFNGLKSHIGRKINDLAALGVEYLHSATDFITRKSAANPVDSGVIEMEKTDDYWEPASASNGFMTKFLKNSLTTLRPVLYAGAITLLVAGYAYGRNLTVAWDKAPEPTAVAYKFYYKSGSDSNNRADFEGHTFADIPSGTKLLFTDLQDPENPSYTLTGIPSTHPSVWISVTTVEDDGDESGLAQRVKDPYGSAPAPVSVPSPVPMDPTMLAWSVYGDVYSAWLELNGAVTADLPLELENDTFGQRVRLKNKQDLFNLMGDKLVDYDLVVRNLQGHLTIIPGIMKKEAPDSTFPGTMWLDDFSDIAANGWNVWSGYPDYDIWQEPDGLGFDFLTEYDSKGPHFRKPYSSPPNLSGYTHLGLIGESELPILARFLSGSKQSSKWTMDMSGGMALADITGFGMRHTIDQVMLGYNAKTDPSFGGVLHGMYATDDPDKAPKMLQWNEINDFADGIDPFKVYGGYANIWNLVHTPGGTPFGDGMDVNFYSGYSTKTRYFEMNPDAPLDWSKLDYLLFWNQAQHGGATDPIWQFCAINGTKKQTKMPYTLTKDGGFGAVPITDWNKDNVTQLRIFGPDPGFNYSNMFGGPFYGVENMAPYGSSVVFDDNTPRGIIFLPNI